MKFLVDENLSPVVAAGLRDACLRHAHVRDLGMRAATDTALIEFAAASGFILVPADTDFGTLLAATGARAPSVVLIRRTVDRRARHRSRCSAREPASGRSRTRRGRRRPSCSRTHVCLAALLLVAAAVAGQPGSPSQASDCPRSAREFARNASSSSSDSQMSTASSLASATGLAWQRCASSSSVNARERGVCCPVTTLRVRRGDRPTEMRRQIAGQLQGQLRGQLPGGL